MRNTPLGGARTAFGESLALKEEHLPKGHASTALTRAEMAKVVASMGDGEEAVKMMAQAIEEMQAALPKGHPFTLRTQTTLAELLMTLGLPDMAAGMLANVLETKRDVVPPKHPALVDTLVNLASLLKDNGQFGEAAALFDEAVEIMRTALPEGHPKLGEVIGDLAVAVGEHGDLVKGIALSREALKILKAALPDGHPMLASLLGNLGGLLLKNGEYTDAHAALSESLAILEKALPPGHPLVINTLVNLSTDINTRVDLRRELSALKLDEILEELSATRSIDLSTQIDAYREYAEADAKRLKFNDMDLSDPVQVAERLKFNLRTTPHFGAFVKLMQMLVAMPASGTKGDAMWGRVSEAFDSLACEMLGRPKASAASARQAAVWRLSLGGERRCAVPLVVGLWVLSLLS